MQKKCVTVLDQTIYVFKIHFSHEVSSLFFLFFVFLRLHMRQPTENHGWYADRSARTVHLALIRQDDLPAATWRVDCQSLLEALLNVRAPHALCIILQGFVQRIPQLLTPTPGGGSRHPLCRRGETTEQGPPSSGLRVCAAVRRTQKGGCHRAAEPGE